MTDDLASRIAQFIKDEKSGDFGSLMLDLFARQYELNAPYRIYCDSLGVDPSRIIHWQEIPAAPARAFKTSTLSCAPMTDIVRTFHSSGTTEGEPSKHYMDLTALDLYKVSLRAGFWSRVPYMCDIIALMPPPDEAVHSSLSYMLGALGVSEFIWDDSAKLAARLDELSTQTFPHMLFGTAFAFMDVFDHVDTRWVLPQCWIYETGGFKGRSRQISREELYSLMTERLNVDCSDIIAEYGMSEMASQYYGTLEEGLTGGHWVSARIIDPITEEDADEGILRHYDLANWNSVAVIQTQDMARWIDKERGAFELLGRAPGAELRGCSLSVEERWLQAA